MSPTRSLSTSGTCAPRRASWSSRRWSRCLRGTRSIASFETGHIGGAPVHHGSMSHPSINKEQRTSRRAANATLEEVEGLIHQQNDREACRERECNVVLNE